MKKLYLILMMLVLLLTSCSIGESNMNFYFEDNISIADKTFEKVVAAIEANDAKLLESYFSDNVQEQVSELHTQATDFLNFIDGKVVSYTSARAGGVATHTRNTHGTKSKEIEAAFTLQTDNQKFYIAIRLCPTDQFDKGNIGIQTICIINANDWQQEYIYRGDGSNLSIPGININKMFFYPSTTE